MKLKLSLWFLLILGVFYSCEVSEGVGGDATIKGHLILEQYNDDYSILVNTLPASDENVYIQYGDDEGVSDDVETGYDGYFEFSYLYEGDYTIYYYSKDSLDALSPKKEILVQVSMAKGESKDLGELKTLETLKFDEGKAAIRGSVMEIYYTYNSVWPNMIPEDTLIATDLAVYLRYGTNEAYSERIRTQGDGSFYFDNLIPGAYSIYVFSEDIKGTKQQVAIEGTLTISANEDEVYDLSPLYIHNL